MSVRRALLFVLLFVLPLWVLGQDDAYDDQAEVVLKLLTKGRFEAARAQSEALIETGREAQLAAVEARGRLLLGRILTENPQSDARQRVLGIQQLRAAARAFRTLRKRQEVDEIVTLLLELTGDGSINLKRMPSVTQAETSAIPSEDSVNTVSLTAIVNLQQQQITALSDSQLRQVLLLERQQRALDESEFARLNDSVLLLQQEQLLSRKEAEVSNQRLQRNFLIALAGGILVVLGVIYSRFRSSQRYRKRLQAQNEIISQERQRSEELLLNILPVTVAAELKDTGKATARKYESASVLFADFKGFSALAASTEPEELVRLLDEAFRAFDEIVAKHGLEKIKTIGDAYMCASGLPLEMEDHAERAVRAGLAMQAYLANQPHFKARIGIHSGPLVAGVVGKHKFVYDVWGDTVNQASRLEVAGEVGRVAISKATQALLGDAFRCIPAGTFEAKNIGKMERFFVEKN
ncbi:MAG: adenylate/guanylate cyclase domain-containing protein [Bacteroidota bacterium]